MSIEAKDLMIGNLVLGKDLDELNQSIGENRIQIITPIMMLNSERYSPICLTSELLSRIEGFKQQKVAEWYIEYDNDYFIIIKSDMSVQLAFDLDCYLETEPYEHIKHLHQLQNLYWCLCGKDLIIKL